MRRVRYAVAASLDGYIAGPNGELTGSLRIRILISPRSSANSTRSWWDAGRLNEWSGQACPA
ncbi:MAG TPA: hypothetical protein VGG97_24705 [Bryobacteraceae bacterium]